MNLGLYNLKYPARKLMGWILPCMASVNPNVLSLALLPIGMAAAWAYSASYFLLGGGLILLRMFFGTLDGLVAEKYNKGTQTGEILNRLTPEIADVMLIGTLALSDPLWGIAALCMCWLTTFSGLVGAIVKKPIQSIGPAGQTDRLFALLLFSCFEGGMHLFLIWCTVGGAITTLLRLKRQFS
jgi:CDP-diacylglycerol--glycerol-3-phosphate 3-phosphatidyltransferase